MTHTQRFCVSIFLSTLSLRRATRPMFSDIAQHIYFYPRSPCGERRLSYFYIIKITVFLSTLSLRRATGGLLSCFGRTIFLSTLSLRRATAGVNSMLTLIQNFYPRSPCGERQHAYQLVLWVLRFLSTLSLRRATKA